MAENKVQFNLKNVHYALLTEKDGTPSWETPVKVPGAVNLNLDQQGEVNKFYADGIVYYQASTNNGYEGDLEMARFPDQMLQEVWGFILNTDKVLVEKSNTETVYFALLFQIDGDANEDYFCMYKCAATRPGIAGATSEESKTPQTQTSTISAVPLEDNRVMARTTAETTESVKTGWFKSVYNADATA